MRADRGAPATSRAHAAGRGWIGLVDTDRYRVVGSAETALFAAWLALVLLVGTQICAWWREGRR